MPINDSIPSEVIDTAEQYCKVLRRRMKLQATELELKESTLALMKGHKVKRVETVDFVVEISHGEDVLKTKKKKDDSGTSEEDEHDSED